MTATTCPPAASLDEAWTKGADDDLRAHLAACAKCSELWRSRDELRSLGMAIGGEKMAADRRGALRTRLLSNAYRPAPPPIERASLRRRLMVALALASTLAAVAFGALLLRTGGGTAGEAVKTARGRVHGDEHARYARESGSPDEVVRLHDGSIDVDVDRLESGERFRVVTADGEVEVRGTAFQVSAEDDRLVAVRVNHGLVAVRVQGEEVALLGPGEAWKAPVDVRSTPRGRRIEDTDGGLPAAPAGPRAPQSPSEERTSVVPVMPTTARHAISHAPLAPPGTDRAEATPAENGGRPSPSASLSASSRGPSLDEVAFKAAWEALRRGDHEVAARGFASVNPASSVGEEAMFWRAVSLVRAGHSEPGRVALEGFRSAFPRSARRHEAAVSLGWILLGRGRGPEALALFREAALAPPGAVRTSAQEGLSRLEADATVKKPAPR